MFQLAIRWHSLIQRQRPSIEYRLHFLMVACWSTSQVPIQHQSVFFKREYIFVWDFFSSDCLLYTPFIDLVLSTMWLHFSFSESTNFCKVMAWAAHVTLWVVYVNNNNKNPWSFIPVPSGIPLTSFQLEKVLSMADFFFPSHWQFSDYCASSSDFLTLSWLKN